MDADADVVAGLGCQPDFLTEDEERSLVAFIDRRARGLPAEDFAETPVIRYPPGASMGWHRDAVAFGPVVVGVSLLREARMRFQRTVGGVRQTAALTLAPRSAYVLSGAARSSWQHSIPPGKSLRYSVTVRTVRVKQML